MRGLVSRPTGPVAAVALLLGLSGCQSPVEDASFSHADPSARIAAARQATAVNDREAIGPMIEMLESDDPAQRIVAIQGLESMTGQTLGFDHADPAAARARAVERWVVWYHERGAVSQAADRP